MRDALVEAGRAWARHPGGARRLAALRGLCDTWVPAVRPPRQAGPLDGFWRRRASDLDVHAAAAGWIATRLPPEDADEVAKLLDVLAVTGFRHLPVGVRAAALTALAGTSAELEQGLAALRDLTLLLHYGLPDATGGNPAWPVLGYPGPPAPPQRAPRRSLRTHPIPHDAAAAPVELTADVCVVGSGAGGGVIAGLLAGAGLDVVVLEAAADRQEPDFRPYELESMANLYWRGGYAPTDDGNVTMLAGAALGGGTTVNWTNCVPPPGHVRARWARQHGLTGLDTAAFDADLAAVLARLGATQDCSDVNGPNDVLRRGAEANGWSWRCTHRNTDPARYDPASAGHMGYGDRSGSKRGTLQTYLADAERDGARIIPGCHADHVLLEGGRAAGVRATATSPDGRQTAVTVHARTVVAAAGALETPALLLRSAIGGPAVGRHLHLHPVVALIGLYPDDQQSWWGPPQSVIVDAFADLADGYGFLLECAHYGPGLSAASLPWRSGRDHKLLMGKLANAATTIGLVRDRGSGTVTVDAWGRSVVHYPLADALDDAHLRRALHAMAQTHAAAGAQALVDLEPARSLWTRGEDLDAWVAGITGRPMGAGGRTLFSAHQMGSARMGGDPLTSVADPEGQLHDTPGVWIGDTSAFPTAVGSNPMLTCMALAHRTSRAILATRA